MKSFRDRNPYLVGLVSVGVLGVLVAAAFAIGIFNLLERSYTVQAVFRDAAGIRADNTVRVAGVDVGRVTSVEPDYDTGTVTVNLAVNRDLRLGPETTAEIALHTLLGSKYIRLAGAVHEPYLHDQPSARRIIPVERTRTAFDVFELVEVGTRNINATDHEKLNQLITQLADTTGGQRETLATLLHGVNRFSTELSARDSQLRSLLERADRLSATLAEKDRTIVALLDQSQAVLDLLSRRSGDLARGLRSTDVAAAQLAGVLAANHSHVDLILETLHPTLDILDRRQVELDRALAFLGPGAFGLALAPSHGPWADVYVRSIAAGLIPALEALVPTGGTE